jgi:hypothetical protein
MRLLSITYSGIHPQPGLRVQRPVANLAPRARLLRLSKGRVPRYGITPVYVNDLDVRYMSLHRVHELFREGRGGDGELYPPRCPLFGPLNGGHGVKQGGDPVLLLRLCALLAKRERREPLR